MGLNRGVLLPEGFAWKPRLLLSPKHTKESSVNIWDLFRTKNIRWISVTLWLVWIDLSITYYVLSLNTSNLHGSIFLNCFLSAVLELPAYTLSWVLFRYFPRRLCLSMSLFLGGLMILFIQLIPSDMNSLAIALEMTGKFGVTVAFALIFAYTAELYPTVLRNTAIGACSMASRIGSISAPYLLSLRSYSVALPYILIGTFTVLAALISLLIPESYGKPLPDSITHMQEFPGIDLSITYSVLSLNTSNLHGSIFLKCFLSAVLEFLTYTLSWAHGRISKLLFVMLQEKQTLLDHRRRKAYQGSSDEIRDHLMFSFKKQYQ